MEARRTLFVSGSSTDQQGLSALKMIDDMIFGFHFHAFEEQIEVPAMSLAFIRMQVEMTRPALLAYANAGQWDRDTNDIVLGLLDTVIKYLRSCILSGEKYLYLTDQYAINVLSSPD